MTQLHKETIEKLEAAIKEAQLQIEELKKPVRNRWRADKGSRYFFISYKGVVTSDEEGDYQADDIRFEKGNYFKTENEAKASNLYTMLGEYDYWIPGVTPCKPSFQPRNLERFKTGTREWISTIAPGESWHSCMYRWKRSEQ